MWPNVAKISQNVPNLIVPCKFTQFKNVTVMSYLKLFEDYHEPIFLAKNEYVPIFWPKNAKELPKSAKFFCSL